MVAFIRELMAADRFVAQVTPYNESPVTAVFELTGLPTAVTGGLWLVRMIFAPAGARDGDGGTQTRVLVFMTQTDSGLIVLPWTGRTG